MKLHVVIVNFRTAELSWRAATAAAEQVASLGGKVVVVENGSGDDSYAWLTAAASKHPGLPIEILESERNGGFGAGNNLALRRALVGEDRPEYIYLLNPDAVPQPGAIAALVEFLDAHPEVGIAGSRIHNPDGSPHASAFRFPSPLGELEGTLRLGLATRLLRSWAVWNLACDHTQAVDWVSGASTMIRRQVLEEIGLFDEMFFLYFEETDLCRRAKLAGWPTWYVHEAYVEHEIGAATGIKDTRRPMPPYWFASRRYYFHKQGGRRQVWLANLGWLAGFCTWRARRRVQGKPDTDPPGMLADFLRYNLRS